MGSKDIGSFGPELSLFPLSLRLYHLLGKRSAAITQGVALIVDAEGKQKLSGFKEVGGFAERRASLIGDIFADY